MHNLLSKIKTALDIWAAFLTRHDLLDKSKLPSQIDSPSLRKALNVIEVMNLSQEERAAYESHLDWLRMEVSTVGKAQVEARAEGIQEKAIQTAIKLLKRGKHSDDEICEDADILPDALAKLKQQHKL